MAKTPSTTSSKPAPSAPSPTPSQPQPPQTSQPSMLVPEVFLPQFSTVESLRAEEKKVGKGGPTWSPESLLPITNEALALLDKMHPRLIFEDASVMLSDFLIDDTIRWTGDDPTTFVNEIITQIKWRIAELDGMIRGIQDHNGRVFRSADIIVTLFVRAAVVDLLRGISGAD